MKMFCMDEDVIRIQTLTFHLECIINTFCISLVREKFRVRKSFDFVNKQLRKRPVKKSIDQAALVLY